MTGARNVVGVPIAQIDYADTNRNAADLRFYT